MTEVILLDTGPLGRVTHPTRKNNEEFVKWFQAAIVAGYDLRVPEIADYELRRKLLHCGFIKSVQRLDELGMELGYVPISTEAMRFAAKLWAKARKEGRPTAPKDALDGDLILIGQASCLSADGDDPIIATENVGHLSRFAKACHWRDIATSG